MPRRPLTLMALLAVLGFGVFGIPALSGATFTSTTTNAISTVTASNDWTAPTVSMNNPGTSVKDTVTLTATASDAQTGIANVVLQYLAPNASTWTTLCTATTSPYSCSWNTKLVADGSYALRAIATDNAGYVTISEPVSTTVANSFLVVLGDPGDILKGTVPLTTTLYNTSGLIYVVGVQYSVAGSGTWKSLCASLIAPYTCSWNTASSTFTQGESYDLRAVATLGSATTYSAVITDVQIDNNAPTVTMTDPGTPLRGTATFAATAADAETGINTVALQAQRSGSGTWTTLCTLSIDPYSCRYDTTQLTDGTYSFRAIATDAAGNTTTSALVTGKAIDNTVSAVSMEDPGAYLSGVTTLTATASSTSGVTSVRIERSPNGTSTWTAVCTDTTSPYTCSFDTTTVAEGLYDFRAVLLDGAGKTTFSAAVTGRRIDNSPLKAYDVQTVNGSAKAGQLGAGDLIRFTYTDQVNLASITTGWTGASLPVTLRLRDGNAVGGLGGSNDTVDVLRTGGTVNLGSVNLKANFIKNNKTATWNATMVASTTTVNGNTATVVTVTLGTPISAGSLRTVSSNVAMIWSPSTSALDLNGRACSAATATELGTLDKDF